jgi:AcrR family transcriptional regulator
MDLRVAACHRDEMAQPDPDARPMRRDATRNQQLVIDAARRVLSELGVDARMDAIAARAGVGIGTVYRHFPNKQALIDELVRLILDELIAAAQSALAHDDGTGLETFLRSLGQSLADHHGYADKIMKQAPSDGIDQLRVLIAQLLDQAREHARVNQHVTPGDILATAWAMRGIIETTAGIVPQAWQRHLDIHLAGLRADPFPSNRRGLTVQQLADIARRQSG